MTTSVNPGHIRENFDVTALGEDAMREINQRVETCYRFNTVTETGIPGFIPSEKATSG